MAQADLDQQVRRWEEATDEIERLRTELAFSQNQSELLRAEVERLKDCNVELETRRNDAQREVETLTERCALYRGVATDLENAIADLRAENDRLRKALETIVNGATHYRHQWVLNVARAALEPKDAP